MRSLVFLVLFTSQAHAWVFTPGLVCRLEHETASARMELTYDPAAPLYTVTLTTPAVLPAAPIFSMRFMGAAGRAISTDRHKVSPDGKSVTAADRGFGNVLDGLQFNDVVEAVIGRTTLTFPLEGASGPVAQFRACEVATGV